MNADPITTPLSPPSWTPGCRVWVRVATALRRAAGGGARLGLLGLGLLVGLASGVAGCGHKIGDACTNSADCDPSGGNRTCDLSQPGGYCIVEGCDARSCPDDSVCMRFFPEQPLLDPAKACDPTATCSGPMSGICCDVDEECLPDVKNPGQAACARTSLEKRACVQSCGGDGDCRGGYVCRASGTCGTLALTLDPAAIPKFCAPMPSAANGSLSLCPR
ncbi:MAG TPA: hypothetical protein VIU64_18725 [Polyangia bacterium]